MVAHGRAGARCGIQVTSAHLDRSLKVSTGDTSGGLAFHSAVSDIRSGAVGTALVVAFERSCNERFFPPRPIYPHYHSTAVDWAETTGRGTFFSFTRIHVTAAAAFADVLVVELDESPQLLTPIDEPSAVLEISDQIGIEPTEYDTGYD